MAGRGVLTNDIARKCNEFLGRKVDQTELRLMPYIQFQMMNDQKIDPAKISDEERAILRKWKDAGHVEGGASGLEITREFWDFINDVLWSSYVAHREQ